MPAVRRSGRASCVTSSAHRAARSGSPRSAVARSSSRSWSTAAPRRTARRCRAPPAPSGRCRSCCRRRRARVVRSVPTMQRSTMPCCIRWPPALSAITVCGTPWCSSSKAVSEAPWLRGRVSSTQTWTGMPPPAPCRSAPCAVPQSIGGEPAGVAVGQHVDGLAWPLPGRDAARMSGSPCSPIARQIATSSSADRGGLGIGAARPLRSRGRLRQRVAASASSAQRRLTAVGRVADQPLVGARPARRPTRPRACASAMP